MVLFVWRTSQPKPATKRVNAVEGAPHGGPKSGECTVGRRNGLAARKVADMETKVRGETVHEDAQPPFKSLRTGQD